MSLFIDYNFTCRVHAHKYFFSTNDSLSYCKPLPSIWATSPTFLQIFTSTFHCSYKQTSCSNHPNYAPGLSPVADQSVRDKLAEISHSFHNDHVLIPDFPGVCFASTKCATIEPGHSWELSPFCGRSTCVQESKDSPRLLELVEDCGPLPKSNPKVGQQSKSTLYNLNSSLKLLRKTMSVSSRSSIQQK